MTEPILSPNSGRPVPRVDGRLKVTGEARYAADHPTDDVAFGVLICSTVARGVVTGIDVADAEAHPQVIRVITDFSGVTVPFDPRQVAFFGQPIAVVVAETLEAANHAANVVVPAYQQEPQVADIDAPDAVLEPSETNTDYVRGNPEATLAAAAVVSDHRFIIERNYHNPMELPATIASWDGDRLTVWDKVQGINSAQEAYAEAFGLDVNAVRVISPFVGGAFGSAGSTWPHQIMTAFAAREVDRPVKLVLSRKQMYSGIGFRATSRQRMAIAADRTGRISTIIHEAHVENSRYEGYQDPLIRGPRSLYGAPNMRSTYRVAQLDINAPTYMRGPGYVSSAFALESAVDDVAHQLNMDPIALRLRNEPARDLPTDLPFSTRRMADCFRRGADVFGWARRTPPRASRDGDSLVGLGTAAACYHTVRMASDASARVNADGTADVASATSDMGPGTYTSMTQVAADGLGMSMSRVRFILGDSVLPKAPSHFGSLTMASVGSAVSAATMMLRDRFIRTAVVDPGSPLSGLAPGDVVVNDGRMSAAADSSRGETYQDLLRRRGWAYLDTAESWSPGDTDDRYSIYAYGAVFAEVAVDEMLGRVRVRRMHACYDAGRVINPRLAHSQAIGGMVGGIGMALLETGDVDFRDGRVVNANMADYLVPVNGDILALDAEFLPAEDTIADPIGVKGLGEVVMVGVPAAIANAVFNATGRRITELPITLESQL